MTLGTRQDPTRSQVAKTQKARINALLQACVELQFSIFSVKTCECHQKMTTLETIIENDNDKQIQLPGDCVRSVFTWLFNLCHC